MTKCECIIGVIYIDIFNEDYSGWCKELRYVISRHYLHPRGIYITSNPNPIELRTFYSLGKAFENNLGRNRATRLSSEYFITE